MQRLLRLIPAVRRRQDREAVEARKALGKFIALIGFLGYVLEDMAAACRSSSRVFQVLTDVLEEDELVEAWSFNR